MGKDNILYLTTEDLKKLKKIGQGTDGSVYEYNSNFLVKIYHNSIKTKKFNNENQEEIKIYTKGKFIKDNDYYANDINYYKYDDEAIKLLPKEAIFKAIEKQNNIEMTRLPIGVVYLDGRFAGCILVKSKGITLHKLMCLPFNARKKLYLNVLKANAELLRNNIYHMDIANSPYNLIYNELPDGSIIKKGHSHILVNPLTNKINLIDLEGKSTIYSEKKEDKYLTQNAYNLVILALEFLFKTDYNEYKDDLEQLAPELEKYNLSFKTIDKLLDMNITQDELEETVKSL